VAAVNRIDNLKTGVSHGAGPSGEINESDRAYARTMGFHIDPHEVRQPQLRPPAAAYYFRRFLSVHHLLGSGSRRRCQGTRSITQLLNPNCYAPNEPEAGGFGLFDFGLSP
jgi:hypothetical protein